MKRLLTDFSTEFRDRVLGILWRQWTTVGVFGDGQSWRNSVIDPESLLLLSCSVARHDARLFDAMMEWLSLNNRSLNIQRLKRILKEESFSGDRVLQALAASVTTSVNAAKWQGIGSVPDEGYVEERPLFFLGDGRPLPVPQEKDPIFLVHGFLRSPFQARGVAAAFRPEPVANLLLRLRAFMGISARCEVLLYLLCKREGSPRAMARECYYYPATMSKALNEMEQSGYLLSRIEGRRRCYRLVPDLWADLFLGDHPQPPWIVWPRLFGALDRLWLFMDGAALGQESPLALASSLRRILRDSVISQLDRSNLAFVFGDDSAYPDESLLPYFVERTGALLSAIEELHVGG